MRATFRAHRIPTPGAKPYIVTVGPDDNIWFCASGTGKIGRLTLDDDRVTEFSVPTPGAEPIGIAGGSDGNLWFTEYGAHRMGRITVAGDIV